MLPVSIRRTAERIARHELGHFVCALTQGFESTAISLSIETTYSHHGASSISPSIVLYDLQELEHYLKRRIVVLNGGSIAESIEQIGDNEFRVNSEEAVKIFEDPNSGASNDRAKARELLQILVNLKATKETQTQEDWAIILQKTCQENWSSSMDLIQTYTTEIGILSRFFVSKMTDVGETYSMSKDELLDHPAAKKLTRFI